MKTKHITSRIDEALKPLGFSRKKITWTRRIGPLVDVIDLQLSKSGETLTVNAGVLDTDVHALCWGAPLEGDIEEPLCTVRTRIGRLIDGKDRWWDESETASIEIAAKIQTYVIPFLERMHSPEAMARVLMDGDVTKQKYPPPIIYLAILKWKMGDVAGSQRILDDLQSKTVEAWQSRVLEVIGRLNTGEPKAVNRGCE